MQDFKSFYSSYTKNEEQKNFKSPKSKQVRFDVKMRKGRADKVVDWEKIFYSSMGIALLLKGLYFLNK